MIRSDPRDGWIFVAEEDPLLCPGCSSVTVRTPDAAVPLGGNMIPDVLVCGRCGATAENPEEVA